MVPAALIHGPWQAPLVHVVAGTPDTVLKKLRFLKDELNIGHGVFYGQESRMSHAATMRSIALFGKEVMPALREWSPSSRCVGSTQ